MLTAEELRKLQETWTKRDERQLKSFYKRMRRRAKNGRKEWFSIVSPRPRVEAKLERNGFKVINGLFGCVIQW